MLQSIVLFYYLSTTIITFQQQTSISWIACNKPDSTDMEDRVKLLVADPE